MKLSRIAILWSLFLLSLVLLFFVWEWNGPYPLFRRPSVNSYYYTNVTSPTPFPKPESIKPVSTTDWITYKDYQHHYSIKHPTEKNRYFYSVGSGVSIATNEQFQKDTMYIKFDTESTFSATLDYVKAQKSPGHKYITINEPVQIGRYSYIPYSTYEPTTCYVTKLADQSFMEACRFHNFPLDVFYTVVGSFSLLDEKPPQLQTISNTYFQFKYPGNWDIYHDNTSAQFISVSNQNIKYSAYIDNFYLDGKQPFSDNIIEVNNYKSSSSAWNMDGDYKNISKQSVTINGHTGIQFIWKNTTDNSRPRYRIWNYFPGESNKIMTIDITQNSLPNAETQKIIQSFTFLKK
jgi:hypothetical protein